VVSQRQTRRSSDAGVTRKRHPPYRSLNSSDGTIRFSSKTRNSLQRCEATGLTSAAPGSLVSRYERLREPDRPGVTLGLPLKAPTGVPAADRRTRSLSAGAGRHDVPRPLGCAVAGPA